MKYSMFLALALLASAAHADEMIARNIGGDEVHLADKPCTHAATLALIAEEIRPQFRNAWAKVGGKYFAACWTVARERQDVVIVYEDGDQARISTGAFRYSPGV